LRPDVDAGSDNCVSAGLVDEWLHARNALSIENFLRDTRFGRSPRLFRLNGFGNCVISRNRALQSYVHRSSFVDAVIIVIQPSMRRTCTTTRLAS
jgi:hypothetical protein